MNLIQPPAPPSPVDAFVATASEHVTQRLDVVPGQTDLIGLMALMFNAPPGGWLGALAQVRQEAGSLGALGDLLVGMPQFQSRFAGKTTPTEILDTFLSFIGLVPGTQAHSVAAAAVLSQLAAGASVGTITAQVLQFLQTTTEPLFQPARQYLGNMVEVATYHTMTLGLSSTSVDDMRALLAKVTSDPDSVAQAKQALDQLVAPPAPSPSAPPPPPPPPALTSADTVGDINTKMGAYTGTAATANAAGMAAQQLEALASHVAKLQANGITGLSLDLGAAQMTDAISAALLGKASGAGVVATNATAAEVDSLVTLVAHIADAGITGTLPLTLAQLADARGTLAPKLAAGLTLAVTGTAAADTIDLTALANAATAAGGADNDTYVVDSATHTIVEAGGGGTDTLQSSVSITLAAHVEVLSLTGSGNTNGTGTADSDTLLGNGGDNLLSGAAGSDVLNAGAGNDTLDGGTGADALTGGTGDDLYVVDDADDTVTEISGQGIDTIASSVTYTLAPHAEVLSLTGNDNIDGTGTADNDTLYGNDGSNQLLGGDGNDSLQGGAGDDALRGGIGDDTLWGGTGDNVLDGGAGTNQIVLDAGSASNRVVIDLSATGLQVISGFRPGTDQIELTAQQLANFEVDGGAFQQNDYDSAGDPVFVLADGNTELWFDADGAGGNAAVQIARFTGGTAITASDITHLVNLQFVGTAGDDSYIGTSANERMSGLGGNDSLNGGGGNDTLDGGTGQDTLAGGSGNDTMVVGEDLDTITDFNAGDDRIHVQGIGQVSADFLDLGGDAFEEDEYGAFGSQAIFVLANGGTELWYDEDGIGGSTANQIVQFTGGVTGTFGDANIQNIPVI